MTSKCLLQALVVSAHGLNNFDLQPMTLIYEFDLDILKMYLHTKSEGSRSRLPKTRARTGHRHTHTYITRCSTTVYSQVNIRLCNGQKIKLEDSIGHALCLIDCQPQYTSVMCSFYLCSAAISTQRNIVSGISVSIYCNSVADGLIIEKVENWKSSWQHFTTKINISFYSTPVYVTLSKWSYILTSNVVLI